MRRKTVIIGTWAAVALAASGLQAADFVDPAAFGLDPAAPAATNAVALQRALDGGRRVVKVTKPGVYMLDRRICFDDDTVFECAPQVVFKRAASYENMFVNRGAWNYHANSNITVRGLNIAVNNMGATPGWNTPCQGLRGQVSFYNVQRVRVYDFKCLDLTAGQYCIQFSRFEDIVLDGFEIRGRKDGVHINGGTNFRISNGVLETGDDGIALNAGDWPLSCTPYMGSIKNGIVENIHDMPGGRCNFARVITGCWREWYKGMKLQRGDIFKIGRNVYTVAIPQLSTNELVSVTPPTHTRGLWKSPEGIPFLWLQDDGETRADIENVVFRDCFLHSKRCISCSYEVGGYARLVHPSIDPRDYPKIDITLDHVVSDSGAALVNGNANAVIRIRGCQSKGPICGMWDSKVSWDWFRRPSVQRILVSDMVFSPADGRDTDFLFHDTAGDVKVLFSGCIFDRKPVVKAVPGCSLQVLGVD